MRDATAACYAFVALGWGLTWLSWPNFNPFVVVAFAIGTVAGFIGTYQQAQEDRQNG
jgi:putative flippase GtrA